MAIDRRRSIALVIVALIAALLPLVAAGPARAAAGDIVVNEIDYDQPGTDDSEYIELKNVTGSPIDLTDWELELVNGNNDSIYRTFTLSVTLAAGDYYVICGIPTNVPNCDLDVTPDTNLIQNGSPDAVAIRDDGGTLIDTVSYEGDTGTPYTEGSGDGLFDTSATDDVGISRCPDGTDTDQNNLDLLSGRAITPGASNTCSISLIPIYDIQGATHYSSFAGDIVETSGVVTAVAFDGFYFQDAAGDGEDATSDGIFAFMGSFFSSSGRVSIGDEIVYIDNVSERIPGGASTGNLSVTEFAFGQILVQSSGNDLPDPAIIGRGGRVPPNVIVIDPDKEPVDLKDPLEAAATPFTPDTDGIDFYESLEGMLVTVEDAVAVSATRRFGSFSSELFTLANNGKDVAPNNARTKRGGIELQPHPDNLGDQNPERVQIQFDASPTTNGTLYPGSAPIIAVGDRLGDVEGVMSYDFGNFEVRVTEQITPISGGLQGETTNLDGTLNHVTVSSYNVLNLSPLPEDDDQRATLGSQIVNALGSPDVIALQEIQDNDGTADSGNTDATLTLQALVDAIEAAGGPEYDFFDVAPADGTSGGVPGGNIRNAFLYNDDRVDLVGFVSLTSTELTSLGVTDPSAFSGTRNPLAATFEFNGVEFTVINNHLSSRFGSTPIFGAIHAFVQAAETAREAQTATLNEVVDALLTDGMERIAVVGDLNTFQWTNDLAEILPDTGPNQVLTNLINQLNDDNVYSFNFEGNSQVLDHFFVTDALLPAKIDIVHVNVDFPRVDDTEGSDHEPLLVRLKIGSQGNGNG